VALWIQYSITYLLFFHQYPHITVPSSSSSPPESCISLGAPTHESDPSPTTLRLFFGGLNGLFRGEYPLFARAIAINLIYNPIFVVVMLPVLFRS
jgi:hypothetical protein